MKREMISEAMNNISEEYRLEALEVHNRDVSEVTNMSTKKNTKKFVIVGIAAALTCALGATAYATVAGRLNVREPEPEETVSYVIPSHDFEVIDEEGNVLTIHEDEQVVVYEDVTREFTFNGPEACNEIQFMPTYLPENYEVSWGNSNEWCESAQGVLNDDWSTYNINVFYASQFGTDGMLVLEEPVVAESVEETETEVIYDLETCYSESDVHVYYHIVYNTVDGYIIVVSSSESSEICENIYNGLEIQTTGNVLTADSFDYNVAYLCNGIG